MSTQALSKRLSTPSVFDDFFRPWNEWFDNGDFPVRMFTVPPVNVTEDKDAYVVTLAVPGMKKEDFRIDSDGNMLTIRSEKEVSKQEKEEKYTRKEYSYSSFSRSFSIPEDVKQDAIGASYVDGVLSIKLPRKVEAKKAEGQKTIPVN
jgi:HSP20 family protein